MGARRRRKGRSLKPLVGTTTYAAWTQMLANLVPDGRTHRLGTRCGRIRVHPLVRHAVGVARNVRGALPNKMG